MLACVSVIGSRPVTRKSSGMTLAAIAMAQLARDVAVHAAVVNVVAASHHDQPGLAGGFQRGERPPAGRQQFRLKFALRRVGRLHRAVARAPRHPDAPHGLRHRLLHLRGAKLEMQRRDEELVLVRRQGRRGPQHPRQRLVPRAVVRGAGFAAVRFGIRDVGNEDIIGARLRQRLYVAVGHLHRIARLRTAISMPAAEMRGSVTGESTVSIPSSAK